MFGVSASALHEHTRRRLGLLVFTFSSICRTRSGGNTYEVRAFLSFSISSRCFPYFSPIHFCPLSFACLAGVNEMCVRFVVTITIIGAACGVAATAYVQLLDIDVPHNMHVVSRARDPQLDRFTRTLSDDNNA